MLRILKIFLRRRKIFRKSSFCLSNILGNIMKKRSNGNSNEDLVFRLNSMIKGSERRGQKKCCSRNQQFVGYNDGFFVFGGVEVNV